MTLVPVALPMKMLRSSRGSNSSGESGELLPSTSLVATTTSGSSSPSRSAIAGEATISAPVAASPSPSSRTGKFGSCSPSPFQA